METELISFTATPAFAYELVERGEAKIKAAQEAEELAVAERDRQWEAERAIAIAEFVAAAQGEVPPELAEFVFATDEFSRNHTTNEAALRVPGFGEIEFQMSRVDGKWRRSTYNPKFRAWAYCLEGSWINGQVIAWKVAMNHNGSEWTVDLEIALAHAYRFGQERERLGAEAETKNAELRERAAQAQAERAARAKANQANPQSRVVGEGAEDEAMAGQLPLTAEQRLMEALSAYIGEQIAGG